MSRRTATDDHLAEDRDIEHASIPEWFITTIRVECSGPETYRATQHDVDVEGYGSTPHLAIVEFVRRAESRCFGDGGSVDGRESSPQT